MVAAVVSALPLSTTVYGERRFVMVDKVLVQKGANRKLPVLLVKVARGWSASLPATLFYYYNRYFKYGKEALFVLAYCKMLNLHFFFHIKKSLEKVNLSGLKEKSAPFRSIFKKL